MDWVLQASSAIQPVVNVPHTCTLYEWAQSPFFLAFKRTYSTTLLDQMQRIKLWQKSFTSSKYILRFCQFFVISQDTELYTLIILHIITASPNRSKKYWLIFFNLLPGVVINSLLKRKDPWLWPSKLYSDLQKQVQKHNKLRQQVSIEQQQQLWELWQFWRTGSFLGCHGEVSHL